MLRFVYFFSFQHNFIFVYYKKNEKWGVTWDEPSWKGNTYHTAAFFQLWLDYTNRILSTPILELIEMRPCFTRRLELSMSLYGARGCNSRVWHNSLHCERKNFIAVQKWVWFMSFFTDACFNTTVISVSLCCRFHRFENKTFFVESITFRLSRYIQK